MLNCSPSRSSFSWFCMYSAIWLAYFDAVQDALIAGYEQNQDFFALLLDNDEKKRELMQVFLEDVYRNLRT